MAYDAAICGKLNYFCLLIQVTILKLFNYEAKLKIKGFGQAVS
jgi:hypothetical protein